MGQVTIYLEDEVERKMLLAVQSSGLSKSKWISKVVQEKVSAEWPDSVKEMAGSWTSFPEVDELRNDLSQDVDRESF